MSDSPKISRVLVGVDFDEASGAALEMAASLGAAWEAGLTVFHAAVEAVPAYFTSSQIGQLEAERAQSRAAVAAELTHFAQQHVAGSVDVVVGEGPPADAIVRLAPAFDLISVGTHRRHGPQRWWLGSVAETIVAQSPRPVLVVPAGASLPDTRRPAAILVAGSERVAADGWVELLRTAFGRIVVDPVDLHQCAPDHLQRADLIVLSRPSHASPSERSRVAHVLKDCVHPVLFVPTAAGVGERSPS